MKKTLSLLLIVIPFACFAQEFSGEVERVVDGDTYDVERSTGSTVDVRLYGINCLWSVDHVAVNPQTLKLVTLTAKK